MPHILLIVEDNPTISDSLTSILRDYYDLITVEDLESAKECLENSNAIKVIFLSMQPLSKIDLEILESLMNIRENLSIIPYKTKTYESSKDKFVQKLIKNKIDFPFEKKELLDRLAS